jgi:hypothetical protein
MDGNRCDAARTTRSGQHATLQQPRGRAWMPRQCILLQHRIMATLQQDATCRTEVPAGAGTHRLLPRGVRSQPQIGEHYRHICTGTGLTPATSAPALDALPPHSAPGLRSLLPHLHRDRAHPGHICAGTGAHRCHRLKGRARERARGKARRGGRTAHARPRACVGARRPLVPTSRAMPCHAMPACACVRPCVRARPCACLCACGACLHGCVCSCVRVCKGHGRGPCGYFMSEVDAYSSRRRWFNPADAS